MMAPRLFAGVLAGLSWMMPVALAAAPTQDAGLKAFVRDTLHLRSFRSARYDLDGDGGKEALVLSTDPASCGSGGCAFHVLAFRHGRWTIVSGSTVTRAPIRVLATSSQGWRDLGVAIGGGGMRPAMVRLRFNGRRYPSNPTVVPVDPSIRSAGTVLIAR